MSFTKETAKRALRTFLQAAISYIVISPAFVDFTSGKEITKSGLAGLAISALAAGLAAAMNLEDKEADEDDV